MNLKVLDGIWDDKLVTVLHMGGGLFDAAVVPDLGGLKGSLAADQNI